MNCVCSNSPPECASPSATTEALKVSGVLGCRCSGIRVHGPTGSAASATTRA